MIEKKIIKKYDFINIENSDSEILLELYQSLEIEFLKFLEVVFSSFTLILITKMRL